MKPPGSFAAPTHSPTPLEEWFGGSCVTDSSGAPVAVYHGTAIDGTTYDTPVGSLPRGAFTVFDKEYCGSVTDSSDARSGFWFTASRERAQDAAADALAEAGSGSAYVYEVFLSIANPMVIDDIRGLEPREVAQLAAEARCAGQDGLLFTRGEYGPPDYLVFEPTQIKSVHNSGAFDPVDPAITDRRANRALHFLANLAPASPQLRAARRAAP